MSDRLRRLALIGAVALPLLGLAVAVGVQRLRSGPAEPAGPRTVPGLDAPVDVLLDSLGVPHIWAGSERDAMFAQGYMHARDRLWQMEIFRRTVEGRLSELFGERTLEADRFLRTLGFRRAAEAGAAALKPDVRRLLEAYAKGARAAVRGWSGLLPPEFHLLRARPGEWSVPLVVGIEKLMAWDLTAYDQSLDLAEARRRLGPERYRRWIAPAYPEWGPTILEGAGGRASGADAPGAPGRALPPPLPEGLLAAATVPAAGRPFIGAASVVRASNSWVVGGERSRSGAPLLANDMHLGLDAPNLWYLVGLHAPGLDVVGMSIPGTPGVVAGRSRGVAWGFTNAYVDDADLVVEKLDPTDSARYLAPGGPRPFRTRREVIRVRGSTPDTLVVRSTRHGPLLTPVEGRAGPELLAFRWVAHEPSTTASALFGMNRSRSADEFVGALSSFGDPHQNVVFADTAGDYGYWLAGRIPLRASGAPSMLPVPGWTGEHDWTGYLPFEEHPHVLNPPEGFVVTANNRQSRGPVSDLISGGHWAAPYRAMRIRERITGRERHDAAGMGRIQRDVRSAFAERHRDAAARAFRGAGLDSAAAALASWDLRSTEASREATLFYAWIESVRDALRERLYGDDDGYVPMRAVTRLLDAGDRPFPGLASSSARVALEEVGGRAWRDVHRLILQHLLGEVPVVGPLFGFGRGPLPRRGSHYTVDVAGFTGGPPFLVRTGPSQRHVSDLSDPDGAGRFVLPGGQSGFPGDPHAWDQLGLWREGRLWRLPLEREAVERRTAERLLLRPEAPPSTPRP